MSLFLRQLNAVFPPSAFILEQLLGLLKSGSQPKLKAHFKSKDLSRLKESGRLDTLRKIVYSASEWAFINVIWTS